MYINGTITKDGEPIKRDVAIIGGTKGNRTIVAEQPSLSGDGSFNIDVGELEEGFVFVFDKDLIKDWNKNTTYSLNDKIKPLDNGYYYECIQGGKSHYEEPEWIINENVIDNNVIWKPTFIEQPEIFGPVVPGEGT